MRTSVRLPKLMLTLALAVAFADAQTTPKGSNSNSDIANVSAVKADQKEVDEKIENQRKEIESLKSTTAVLTKSLEQQQSLVFGFGGLISLLLIVGSISSFTTLWTDRKRLTEMYDLSIKRERETSARDSVLQRKEDTAYDLSLIREGESSMRDRSLFKQSTETILLVNETLKLAKDASIRASKALEERLNRQHKKLEKEAADLIEESSADTNFKVLVEDSNFRSILQTLASEITALQTNLNILESADDMALFPYCSFIKGMEQHLDQHFKQAIEFWKHSDEYKDAPPELRVMALYWIGYEQNNLGEFEAATKHFDEAAQLAHGHLKFELKRIRIESKFFNEQKFSASQIVSELEALHAEAQSQEDSEEFRLVKSQIATTLGNVYLDLGRTSLETGDDASSRMYYEKARETLEHTPIKNKWIWFGYAEACDKLGDTKIARQTVQEKVRQEAELEYLTRPEPRTRVLGQTTVLLCAMITNDSAASITSHLTNIKTTLGTVDKRLTIYSQFRRRNVRKEQFMEDLDSTITRYQEKHTNVE